MLENPLKEVLVKKAAGGFGTPYFGGNQSDLQAANKRLERNRLLSRLPDSIASLDPSNIDNTLLPYLRAYNVFDANGQVNELAVERLLNSRNSSEYFDSSGGVIGGDPYANTLSKETEDFDHLQDDDVYNALKKGFLARKKSIQSGLKDFGAAVNDSMADIQAPYEYSDTTPDLSNIEDPGLIEKQVNSAPAPAEATTATETPASTPATDVKNPLISIEQARGLLAKGIAPTSIGGYSQILGSDGTNARAQQELELMDKDPTYNPFANTQAKYVQKLNRMRLLDQYDPKVIMAENQRIQHNQAKLDADRRSRMNAAQYYAGQGVQGASDYHNYMTRGGQLSQAGQQWRDNFDVAGWNRQQQANKTKFRAQQPTTNPMQVQAPLGVEPRPVAEQAAMRKVLGHADTSVNAASNKANGLSNTISEAKFPVSVAPPNNGTTHTSTTPAGAKIYTKPTAAQTKSAFVKNPFTNTK